MAKKDKSLIEETKDLTVETAVTVDEAIELSDEIVEEDVAVAEDTIETAEVVDDESATDVVEEKAKKPMPAFIVKIKEKFGDIKESIVDYFDSVKKWFKSLKKQDGPQFETRTIVTPDGEEIEEVVEIKRAMQSLKCVQLLRLMEKWFKNLSLHLSFQMAKDLRDSFVHNKAGCLFFPLLF